MKRKAFLILMISCFLTISIWGQEKQFISINPSESIKKMKKRKIQSELYSTENQAENYVQYLLDNKLLNIDNNAFYSISISDEKNKWLVFLFLSEKPEKDLIIDTLDYPLKYIFYLDKKTGKISDLFLMLQN